MRLHAASLETLEMLVERPRRSMRLIIQCVWTKSRRQGALPRAIGIWFRSSATRTRAKKASADLRRPDDDCGDGRTWRQRLLFLNESGRTIPSQCCRLIAFTARGFSGLVDWFGLANVFILSAG